MTRALPGPAPSKWPNRLARMPRWALALCAVAVLIPTIVGVVLFVVFGLTLLLILLAAVLVVGGCMAIFWKFHQRPSKGNAQGGSQIVVSSRVIDP